jgi:hypothetical protein
MPNIDRYQIIGRVAAGSTALVYKAHDPQLGRDVAIKQLSGAGPQLREQYRAEARTLATLDSPNIVAIYDFVEDASGAYIVEEWVEGASLGAMLTAGAKLTPVQAVGILHGALSGLAHAHQRGIVHRDVSPANILIDRAGTSKLVDFGLASATGSLGSSGARAYQSPEALAGQPVTPRSDVYSAAALLAHLLKGRPTIPPDAKGIPEPIATVITYSLAGDPQSRPPTAAELLAWLDQTADQTFGAGWLSQASVAGLVAAAGTVPIVAVAALGTAGAAAAGTGTAAGAAAAGGGAAATSGAAAAGGGIAASGSGAGSGAAALSGVGSGMAGGAGNVGTGLAGKAAGHGAAKATAHAGRHGIAKGALVKVGAAAIVVAGAATATAVALTSGGGSSKTAINGLTGESDLYLATVSQSVQITPNQGKRPVAITVKSGAHTVSFPSVTGKIGCCTDPKQVHGPDGDNGKDFGHGTDIPAANGISGVKHATQTLFVAGVFVGSSKPDQTGQVDLSNGNNELVQAPQLGQVFFIGDGHTASGKLQKIEIPQGAKTMYVGFVDASSFVGPFCCYDDNPGKLKATYEFSSARAQGQALPTVATTTSTPPPPSSPPVSATSAPPLAPTVTVAVDGPPITLTFTADRSEPQVVGFTAPAGPVFLHVTQLSPPLAQPFVRFGVASADGTVPIAAPDFDAPTPASGFEFEVPAQGDYVISVTPAGVADGTITLNLTSH